MNYRNIGISAHIDAGKTTLTERILYYTGLNYKIGEVHDGEATMDWLPQEKERGITINSACTTVDWKKNDKNYYINIIDTPGHVDFTLEVERSMRVIDSVCLVFCAVSGVQAQSETVWKQAEKYKIPKLIFINKMDRIGADFYKVINQIKNLFKNNPIPIFIPYYISDKFIGVIDLINFYLILWDDESKGLKYSYDKIPENFLFESNKWRENLIESSINDNDFYIEKYFNKLITNEDLIYLIKKKTLISLINPVICGSALKNKGVQCLLDSIIDFLPSPSDLKFFIISENKVIKKKLINNDEFIALAFKIVNDIFIGQLVFLRIYSGFKRIGDYIYNSTKKKREKLSRILSINANNKLDINSMRYGNIVGVTGLKYTFMGDSLCESNSNVILENIFIPKSVISQSIDVLYKKDQEKLFVILDKFNKEDPSFNYYINNNNQIIINGMGELHLEIIVDKIKSEYNLNILVNKPKVSFKESIKSKVLNIEGKYIKQSGGRGNYGHVVINIEPSCRGCGYNFINKIKGGVIPKEYISCIDKSIKFTLDQGIIYGYQVTDINVYLIDGSYHDVDSNENAYRIASSIAIKSAIMKSNCILLEPIMSVIIESPEDYIGDIISDISSKRGILEEIKDLNNFKIIKANIPLSELFGYSTTLRSFTKGRATYSMNLLKYSEINIDTFKKLNIN